MLPGNVSITRFWNIRICLQSEYHMANCSKQWELPGWRPLGDLGFLVWGIGRSWLDNQDSLVAGATIPVDGFHKFCIFDDSGDKVHYHCRFPHFVVDIRKSICAFSDNLFQHSVCFHPSMISSTNIALQLSIHSLTSNFMNFKFIGTKLLRSERSTCRRKPP